MTRKLRPVAADAGRTLAEFLTTRLGEPAAEIAARIAGGSVFLDNRRVRDPQTRLVGGERVVVHQPPERTQGFRIVHLDEDTIVVDKPVGLPVQATRDGGGALDEQVAALHPGARLVHRIDRDTSGLVLFTRHPEAHRRFAALLATGGLRRVYRAVVVGEPETRELDFPIAPDPEDRRRFSVHDTGRPTRTRLRRLDAQGGRSLVELELVTGRTHQARVHLAHAGHPILGDPIYAPPEVRALSPRLLLHSGTVHTTSVTWSEVPAFSEASWHKLPR